MKETHNYVCIYNLHHSTSSRLISVVLKLLFSDNPNYFQSTPLQLKEQYTGINAYGKSVTL